MKIKQNKSSKKGSASANRGRDLYRAKADGFTLIELLVVVAIIALLSAIVLVAMANARQKARNAKRLSDITQLNNVLELYFASNKGYPADTTPADGVPDAVVPTYVAAVGLAPLPSDGPCIGQTHSGAAGNPPVGVQYNTYYYVPVGT